ncbi:MAG: hypothetical protein EP338_08060 [Bacteroidetes bacterium]|nr:MAG: hypothetical protein EP338_08060 [Bacteroidota bacterium]
MKATISFYQELAQQKRDEVLRLKKEIRKIRLIRLFLFIAVAGGAYLLWKHWPFFIATIVGGIALFLWAVSRTVDLKLQLEKDQMQINFCEEELQCMLERRTSFDQGAEFINSLHPYSSDLDLFAPNGIFNFFNRSTSQQGKSILATLLLKGSEHPEKNKERVELFSHEMEWTQRFRIAASIASRSEAYDRRLTDFCRIRPDNPAFTSLLRWFIPVIGIGGIILLSLNLISSTLFMVIMFLNFGLVGMDLKRTNLQSSILGRFEHRFKSAFEQTQLVSELNAKHKHALFDQQQLANAEKGLHELIRLHQRFEFRMNFLISIPLNLLVGWDYWQRIALERWIDQYGEATKNWEILLEENEAFISAACIRYNFREESCYAKFASSDSTEFHFLEMKHPLLSQEISVPNNLDFGNQDHFMILTGPNMAGKSTYLRSIGINIMLANCGFPVFAHSFTLPKVRLYTSMRASDDITQSSSYFHAELSRLSALKESAGQGDLLFVLLDEILRGTNSKDKAEGSQKFLVKLRELPIKGVIATHDLSLCGLEDSETGFTCYYFDSTIKGDELSFDYQIRPGICQNMNASFLLKQMNLID